MKPLREAIVGQKGFDHFRVYLENAGDSLSENFLRYFDGGELRVLIPDDLCGETIENFRTGGVVLEDSENADEFLAAKVEGFLQASPFGIAAFEYRCGNDWERHPPPTSFFLFRPSLYATWDGTAWHPWEVGMCIYLKSADCTRQSLTGFINEAGRGSGIGFLAVLDEQVFRAISQGVELSALVLDEIARNAQHVVIPAFDKESYLIWSRRDEQQSSGSVR